MIVVLVIIAAAVVDVRVVSARLELLADAFAGDGVAATATTDQATGIRETGISRPSVPPVQHVLARLEVGGVIVGTLAKTTGANAAWTLTNNTGITFNEDGAGGGFATLSESGNTGAHRIALGGTVMLADDLLIANLGSSNTSNGSITLTAAVGGTGNVTISSNSNNVVAGQIVMNGSNTFAGSVRLRKGALTFNNASAMGSTANVVTLGDTASNGGGDLNLVASANYSGALANKIVVDSSGVGAVVIGGISSATSTGNSDFSGAITLNRDVSFTSSNTLAARVTLSGIVSGAGALTKIGTGQGDLTGANTFTGDTRISTGVLRLGAASGTTSLALQNSTLDLNAADAGTLNFGVSTATTITSATFGGLKGTRNLSLVNMNTTPAAVALSVGNNDSSQTYSGILSGAGSILKIGSGTQTLDGNNTYIGSTTVMAGKLLIDGTTTGQGDYSVAATLGGSGAIGLGSGKKLAIASGGHLAPGTTTGILGISGTQTGTPSAGAATANLVSGSFFDVDIAGTSVGGGYDQLSVAGTIDLGGATLNVNRTLALDAGQFFTIILNDGMASGDAVLNTFAGLAEGATVLTHNGFDLKITYTAEANAPSAIGNDVMLYTVPVPEPAGVAMIGLSGAALLRRRRVAAL